MAAPIMANDGHQNLKPPMASGWIPTPFGGLRLAATARGIRSVAFAAARDVGNLPDLAHDLPEAARWLGEAAAQIDEYLAGRRTTFDLPLDPPPLSEFQRGVLGVLGAIPWGETRSYAEVAMGTTGVASDARFVGEACGANPLPVIIPCHRVIRTDGRLGGFGGGYRTKVFLLRLEGVQVPDDRRPAARQLALVPGRT